MGRRTQVPGSRETRSPGQASDPAPAGWGRRGRGRPSATRDAEAVLRVGPCLPRPGLRAGATGSSPKPRPSSSGRRTTTGNGAQAGRRRMLDRGDTGEAVAQGHHLPRLNICVRPFCVSARPPPLPRTGPLDGLSVGEQVDEAQAAGQFHERLPVLMVGLDPAFSPTPYGVAIGLQAAGDLRPRQARLILEPLRHFGKLSGKS